MRKNLYEIESKNNLSTQKIKEIEKRLSAVKKYHDYDDAAYIGIWDIGNLFNEIAFNEDYYKPIKTKSAFNGNFIKYESNGDKYKNFSVKKYLHMIRPYLRDNKCHKIPKILRVHSSNEVIDYKTQFGEWKIQLTMSINFISSKDSDETRNMYAKNNNIEIMVGSEALPTISNHWRTF